MAVSMGFKALVSFLLAIQTTGFWLFPRRVCPPLPRQPLLDAQPGVRFSRTRLSDEIMPSPTKGFRM